MEKWAIEGKTFLITGAASGLGALYAEAFLEGGAKRVAALDINEKVGLATVARLNATHPGRAVFVRCDVSQEEDIARAFDAVLGEFGHIDVLVNNAGIMNDSPDIWRKSCEVNYQGLVSLTLKGARHMRRDAGGRGGTIVNVASVAGLARFRQLPIYCGTKMAVLHFSQSFAEAPFFEETGVRVLTICFGATETPLLHDLAGKSYDTKAGQELAAIPIHADIQKTESAVAACLKMFEEGAPASVWLSIHNKPGQDITNLVEQMYAQFAPLL